MIAGDALAAMDRFQVGTLDDILGGRSPLVLAPHPDDESLGCGGLLCASVEGGLDPSVLIVTDGAASHPDSVQFPPARLRDLRREEALAAIAALGMNGRRVGFLNLPDAAAPHAGAPFERAVEAIVATARQAGSDVLLSPWRHDPHGDHLAVHKMACRAAQIGNLAHLAYPVWGLTLPADAALEGPLPCGWRFDVQRYLDRKRAAIAAHRSQASDLISDAAGGFRLPAHLLALVLARFETYVTNP